MQPAQVQTRPIPLYKTLRAQFPGVPIVFAEVQPLLNDTDHTYWQQDTTAGAAWASSSIRDLQGAKRSALLSNFNEIRKNDSNVFHVSANSLYNMSYDPQHLIRYEGTILVCASNYFAVRLSVAAIHQIWAKRPSQIFISNTSPPSSRTLSVPWCQVQHSLACCSLVNKQVQRRIFSTNRSE